LMFSYVLSSRLCFNTKTHGLSTWINYGKSHMPSTCEISTF
jgi:hypothetical protein